LDAAANQVAAGIFPEEEQVMPEEHALAAAGSQGDRYLLRDLIWCGLCDVAMEPVVLSGTRYYACKNGRCPRPIPADGVELLVWQQYAVLYEGTEVVVPTALRRDALRRKLTRVRIGTDMFEFWCEWKDRAKE
jgi:hypothetical protein